MSQATALVEVAGPARGVTGPFTHRYPSQRVHYGIGATQRLAELLATLGVSRAMLVCGQNVNSQGWPVAIAAAAGGRVAGVWSGVRPHAPAETIDAGTERFLALEADALISVGGGSAHDTLRAIALCAATGQPMLAHFPPGRAFVRHPPVTGVPALVAIPSTFSAAETSSGGGIVAANRKYVFTSDSLHIGEIVLDPDVFATTPLDTLLASGINALHHAVARLFSPARQPIADAQFLRALTLLPGALRALRMSGVGDEAALADAIIGAHLSGSTNVVGGVGHAIAHVLGGRYRVSHGVAHGIAMPRAMVFDAGADCTTALRAGLAVGLSDRERPVERFERFLLELLLALGLPTRLRDIDVPHEELPLIASEVMADFSAAQRGAQRSAPAIEAVLERAW